MIHSNQHTLHLDVRTIERWSGHLAIVYPDGSAMLLTVQQFIERVVSAGKEAIKDE